MDLWPGIDILPPLPRCKSTLSSIAKPSIILFFFSIDRFLDLEPWIIPKLARNWIYIDSWPRRIFVLSVSHPISSILVQFFLLFWSFVSTKHPWLHTKHDQSRENRNVGSVDWSRNADTSCNWKINGMDEGLPGRATICGVFWQQAAPTNWINRRRFSRVSLNYTARHDSDPRFLSFTEWKMRKKRKKQKRS